MQIHCQSSLYQFDLGQSSFLLTRRVLPWTFRLVFLAHRTNRSSCFLFVTCRRFAKHCLTRNVKIFVLFTILLPCLHFAVFTSSAICSRKQLVNSVLSSRDSFKPSDCFADQLVLYSNQNQALFFSLNDLPKITSTIAVTDSTLAWQLSEKYLIT